MESAVAVEECRALEEVLPDCAVAEAVREDIPDAPLFPEEEALVGRAVEGRRREFRTGRACAHAALARLGARPCAIPAGPRGAPRWPAGVVGSITHCAGYRASAVAWASDLAAIGIDAEPDARLPERVLGAVATPAELLMLRDLTRTAPEVRWDRLLFSAKEAAYKAWFPMTGRWLGLEDMVVELDRASRAFSVRLPDPAGRAPTGLSGEWLARDGILLTAIALPATG